MATVNKASLRTEFDALKARFESLCAAGKMSAESRALVDALLMLFELLMAVFMEKHTPKSSANSSLPASQSPNDATARSRPGAKGKGPSYNDARYANTRTREHVRVLAVDSCARCGEDLTDTACTGHQRRTLVDIVFEKVVRHADAEIKHCTRCHAQTRARFPAEMSGPLQYGPGVKAYVVHLLIAQMLSLKRVAQSMHALIGQLLSEATLLGYVAQLHRSLAEWERHAIERLLASPAMHVDETSLRVDRKNHWIHVYSAGTLTVKRLHPKRGCEAIEAIGIIPRYGGVAVHDCCVNGGVKPRINGEQRVAEATTCRVERQGVASRQAALRLLRCAPALRVTRRNPLTQLAFMAGSRLPAVNDPLCENTAIQKVNPHILCSPLFGAFGSPSTLLGLLLELHALRARIMRCALAARADLHRRCP